MTVEPIRELKTVDRMYKHLRNKSLRNGLLFKMGVNTILRISDILLLKYSDIFAKNGDFRRYLVLNEGKTDKIKKIPLNRGIRRLIKEHCKHFGLSGNDWIFFSVHNPEKHLDRVTAYKILKAAARDLNIPHFGTHSMRKTLAYYIYKKTRNIALVMKMLNHTRPSVTMRYIGVDQEDIDEAYEDYSI